MKNKFENLRNYLPVTKELYDQIAFNYFYKQKHDQLYLGEHLHITNSKIGSLPNWTINYKGNDILHFRPSSIYHGGEIKKRNSIFEYRFVSAYNAIFSTDSLFSFDQETKELLSQNYYYEHTIINCLVKMVKNYVIRIFNLSSEMFSYNYDREMVGGMFNIKFEHYMDENHREVALYFHDAYHQRIGLLEKGEIDNMNELKVEEKI